MTYHKIKAKIKIEWNKLRNKQPVYTKLQVETLGSDGQRPILLQQNDIDNMDEEFREVNSAIY